MERGCLKRAPFFCGVFYCEVVNASHKSQFTSKTPHRMAPLNETPSCHSIWGGKKKGARESSPKIILKESRFYALSTLCMCFSSSTTLAEYPISLSYQLTTFTKLSFSPIPAPASKKEVQSSPMKSLLTTASSV